MFKRENLTENMHRLYKKTKDNESYGKTAFFIVIKNPPGVCEPGGLRIEYKPFIL